LRVAIDARMIRYTGIGRYIQNLVLNLASIDKTNSYSILVNEESEKLERNSNFEFRTTSYRIPVYSLREQSLLPFDMANLKPDIIHYPSFNVPVISTRPVVTTIHDLVYYLFPEACPNAVAHIYARFLIARAARLSRKIITVSEHSKTEITRHLNVNPDKVAVIYNGVSPLYRPVWEPEKLKKVMRKYGISGDYILYVGNHQERKNLKRLVSAYSALGSFEKVTLVMAGKVDSRRRGLYEAVDRSGLSERVRFIGEVPEEDLPALYSGALLFVFPSLYEGFGLPPLEAMACATAVVTSNAASLPEVVGDAAVTVDPEDTAAITRAMDGVIKNKDLRERLRARGLERTRMFCWETAARKTLKVYEEVYGK